MKGPFTGVKASERAFFVSCEVVNKFAVKLYPLVQKKEKIVQKLWSYFPLELKQRQTGFI